ncbi:MAG: cell division protein FtsL [Deltaproteobacteria bacterium]|nr:cell division protein FtsL [Deltaproteobacteria bacterium]
MSPVASMYRIFKREGGSAASVRVVVIVMVALACALTAIGILRVSRQHEVLRIGFELSRTSDRVRGLREQKRALELERATLTAPDRIRRLATQLGMTPVSPDKIRVVSSEIAVNR